MQLVVFVFLQKYSKNCGWILMKISGNANNGIWDRYLNVGGGPDHCLDQEVC